VGRRAERARLPAPRQLGGSRGSAVLTTQPFVRHHRRYEQWFERHRAAYVSELLAVRALLPWEGRSLEIGVGTGRFAGPLGLAFGIDPAREVLGYARRRGVTVVRAVGEALPFRDAAFDHVLLVTTLCFVADPAAMLRETARVLRPGGVVVIGFIDRESPLGREYRAHQAENVFYRHARFFAPFEVASLLEQAGFRDLAWVQTLYGRLPGVRQVAPLRDGTGQGAFVVVRGCRALTDSPRAPS
jgi:SAM-dependent methyltransferase